MAFAQLRSKLLKKGKRHGSCIICFQKDPESTKVVSLFGNALRLKEAKSNQLP
jgi:hypothetical protein